MVSDCESFNKGKEGKEEKERGKKKKNKEMVEYLGENDKGKIAEANLFVY